MARRVSLINLGRMRYLPALQIQNALANRLKAAAENNARHDDFLVTVEHEPVYTTGIRTKEYSGEEETRLKRLGADFVRTNRGGLITFHGPGQLVVYPILNLKNYLPVASSRKALLGMKWYVCKLEQVVIDVCSDFGLKGGFTSYIFSFGDISAEKCCDFSSEFSNSLTKPIYTWYTHNHM